MCYGCKQGKCNILEENKCCYSCYKKIYCDRQCIYLEDVNTENECKFIIKDEVR